MKRLSLFAFDVRWCKRARKKTGHLETAGHFGLGMLFVQKGKPAKGERHCSMALHRPGSD